MVTNGTPIVLKSLSYSGTKLFLDNRMKFRKKYILKEDVKDDNEFVRLGNLVDFELTADPLWDEHTKSVEWEKQFYFTKEMLPGGQMGEFVEALKKRTREAVDANKVITKSMEELITEAFNDIKYNKKGEEVKFKKKDVKYVFGEFLDKKIGYDYYIEFRDNMDKTVVTHDEIETSEAIANDLRRDRNTYEIFNPEEDHNVEWFNQFPFEVEIEGYTITGKVDRMKIDHRNKIIKPYDIKVTYQVETFEWAYLDDFYYLQNGIYFYGLLEMFPDYFVEPVSFIVADSNGFLRPLVWHTSAAHARQGIEGFDYRGRHYKGAKEALREIRWHCEKNEWRISFDNYRNFGNLSIKDFAL